jgi:hypothetical protein
MGEIIGTKKEDDKTAILFKIVFELTCFTIEHSNLVESPPHVH